MTGSHRSRLRWGEALRLTVSYQRYAALLLAAAIGSPLLARAVVPDSGTALAAASLVGLWLLAGAVRVGSRLPHKLRATRVYDQRIRRGSFSPEMLRGFCEDPCFRVVARELLGRAGLAGRERRALVRRYAAEARNEPSFILFHLPDEPRTTPAGTRGNTRDPAQEAPR